MKSEIEDGGKEIINVTNEFHGLAMDKTGNLWLINSDFANTFVVVGAHEACDIGYTVDKENINNYGPFTKFNGRVILEN